MLTMMVSHSAFAPRSHPSYNTPPYEAPMPFVLRPSRRFPVQCAVTYNAGPFQGQGTVENFLPPSYVVLVTVYLED